MLRNDDLGKLLLRIATGGLMLFHGVHKLQHGVGGISKVLESNGLPASLAYGSYVGEVVAPVLILIGLLTRPAAAVLAFTMVNAIFLAHRGDLGKLTPPGGWFIELPALFLFAALALLFTGAGKYSVSRGRGAWD
jgi:putative oxidoreductase